MRRYAMLKHTLAAMGVEPDRVRLVWASAAEGQQLAEAVDKLVEDVRKLGPLHWPANWAEDGRPPGGPGEHRQGTRGSDGGAVMSRQAAKTKGKLAIYWAASCGGCEIAMLADRRQDPRRGRGLRHRPLALRHRRQGPRHREDGRRRASTSASSTAASAPASRNTWPSCSAASRRSWWPSAPAPRRAASPGLANLNDRQAIFDTVYKEGSATAPENPAGRPPAAPRPRCPRARCTCRCSTTR